MDGATFWSAVGAVATCIATIVTVLAYRNSSRQREARSEPSTAEPLVLAVNQETPPVRTESSAKPLADRKRRTVSVGKGEMSPTRVAVIESAPSREARGSGQGGRAGRLDADDERAWKQADEDDVAEAYEKYLGIWPKGRHAGEASARAARLLRQQLLAKIDDNAVRKRYLAFRTPAQSEEDQNYGLSPWILYGVPVSFCVVVVLTVVLYSSSFSEVMSWSSWSSAPPTTTTKLLVKLLLMFVSGPLVTFLLAWSIFCCAMIKHRKKWVKVQGLLGPLRIAGNYLILPSIPDLRKKYLGDI